MTYIPTTPLVLEALRRHGSATLQELATELELTVTEVAANVGGLHDYGYATKYGNWPTSAAYWVGPDDEYVAQCLERVGVSS